MAKYRKKPVEIEAIQFTDDDYATLCDIGSLGLHPEVKYNPTRIEIHTLEGTMTASLGDYIIKGVNGEFYPCKPDIFEKTYEPVVKLTDEQIEDAIKASIKRDEAFGY